MSRASTASTWRWFRSVRDDPTAVVNASDVVVAAVLASHADEATMQAWPSASTIAAEARLSRQTVVSSLARLEFAGWVSGSRRAGHATVFTLIIDDLSNETTPRDDGVSNDATPLVLGVSKGCQEGVASFDTERRTKNEELEEDGSTTSNGRRRSLPDALEELIVPLERRQGESISEPALSAALDAWRQDDGPTGIEELARQARGAERPLSAFAGKLLAGGHVDAAEGKRRREAPRKDLCEECGVGGGTDVHAADCPLATPSRSEAGARA